MIRFLCYYCDAVLKTPDEKVGRTINCPRCRKMLKVPANAGQQEPEKKKKSKGGAAAPAAVSLFQGRMRRFVRFTMKLGAAVLLLGAASAGVWYYLQPGSNAGDPGPVTENKNKDKSGPQEPDWIANLRSDDVDTRYAAARQLVEREDAGGVDALGGFLLLLQDMSTDERSTEMRDMALVAITKMAGKLEDNDKKAVVAQLRDSTAKDPDPKLKLLAISTLGSLGAEAAPALTALMRDQNKNNRLKAAEVMKEIKSEVSGYVPEMIKAIPYADRHGKVLIASVIVAIKPNTPQVLDELLEGLKTSDEEIRVTAILAMGEMGKDAKDALGALFDVANNDPNTNVKNAANRTYRKLLPFQTKTKKK